MNHSDNTINEKKKKKGLEPQEDNISSISC